jgi:hypothetical protein
MTAIIILNVVLSIAVVATINGMLFHAIRSSTPVGVPATRKTGAGARRPRTR